LAVVDLWARFVEDLFAREEKVDIDRFAEVWLSLVIG
jgi:hypothetical protein